MEEMVVRQCNVVTAHKLKLILMNGKMWVLQSNHPGSQLQQHANYNIS